VGFEGFFRSEYPRVFASLVVTFNDVTIAEDAAEEAFAKSWVRWRRVRRMEHPTAWVARVAFNEALRDKRQAERSYQQSLNLAEGDWADSEASAELRADLARLLRVLSPRQRAVLVLRFYLDMSVDETARVLGIAEGTVKRHTADALGRLTRRVKGDKSESSEMVEPVEPRDSR
jgi:RNA polymerase sigma factor (sigma-70 family)